MDNQSLSHSRYNTRIWKTGTRRLSAPLNAGLKRWKGNWPRSGVTWLPHVKTGLRCLRSRKGNLTGNCQPPIRRRVRWKREPSKPGHEGHCRKKQVPTGEPVLLTPPQEVLENPDFKKTSKTIAKQMVNIRLVLEVTQYHADVYYNSKTGERIHAQFPAGVTDEVNYGGSIKAFLSLLNNECCTSLDKSRRFLSDLTDSKP